jgi:ABC-2 type transport system ATP-binding protein
VRVFGLEPRKDESAVKSRLAYVPDAVAFYPWMTVRDTLDYLASFRQRWDHTTEKELLGQFRLDATKKVKALSKGQKTQLALIGAVCAQPDLLVLDEPTSGLDPIVRREFIQTVIGAYQGAEPGRRTVFVSTHLITEFEGLIDDFTIVEDGRAVLTSGADEARSRFRKIRARFAGVPPRIDFVAANKMKQEGRELEITVNGDWETVLHRVKALDPLEVTLDALSLEEIFVATLK